MAGLDCGSQVTVCEYPVHFDTYRGCSHGCRYCFAQLKVTLDEVRVDNCYESLKRFISGNRTSVTKWCDWAIPLHWGGVSDPFQPIEKQARVSLRCLELLAETGYPFIVSTKGALAAEEPYLSLLAKSNAVVQVSMVCPSYDVMELGAPTFSERLEMLGRLSERCKRVIVRAQPYIREVRREFISVIPSLAEAGAYGVTVEGIKFKKKKPGLVKVGGDYCYKESDLRRDYAAIREACHREGIKFFCAENRLRPMGDSTACCGCGDLEGFAGNKFNAVNLLNGEKVFPTQAMQAEGSAGCFRSIYQESGTHIWLNRQSFAAQMVEELGKMRCP